MRHSRYLPFLVILQTVILVAYCSHGNIRNDYDNRGWQIVGPSFVHIGNFGIRIRGRDNQGGLSEASTVLSFPNHLPWSVTFDVKTTPRHSKSMAVRLMRGSHEVFRIVSGYAFGERGYVNGKMTFAKRLDARWHTFRISSDKKKIIIMRDHVLINASSTPEAPDKFVVSSTGLQVDMRNLGIESFSVNPNEGAIK